MTDYSRYWNAYSVRNGYVPEPIEATATDETDLAERLAEAEDRLAVMADWLVDARARLDELENRIAS